MIDPFKPPYNFNFIHKFAPLLSPPKPITSECLEIDALQWGWCWWTVRENTKDMPVFQHVEVSTSTVPRCLGEMVKVNGLHRPAEFLGLTVAQLVLAMREAEQRDVDQYAQQHPEFGCPRQRLVVEVTGTDLHGIVSSPFVTFSHTPRKLGLQPGMYAFGRPLSCHQLSSATGQPIYMGCLTSARSLPPVVARTTPVHSVSHARAHSLWHQPLMTVSVCIVCVFRCHTVLFCIILIIVSRCVDCCGLWAHTRTSTNLLHL